MTKEAKRLLAKWKKQKFKLRKEVKKALAKDRVIPDLIASQKAASSTVFWKGFVEKRWEENSKKFHEETFEEEQARLKRLNAESLNTNRLWRDDENRKLQEELAEEAERAKEAAAEAKERRKENEHRNRSYRARKANRRG